jgi:hypothetical protein
VLRHCWACNQKFKPPTLSPTVLRLRRAPKIWAVLAGTCHGCFTHLSREVDSAEVMRMLREEGQHPLGEMITQTHPEPALDVNVLNEIIQKMPQAQ